MEKYHLYNQYVLNLFEKRFAFGAPGETSTEVPADAKKADADKEKTEPAKEGPTPSAEESKRNTTRTHADSIRKKLIAKGDNEAKNLANKIDDAYKSSVKAENTRDKGLIDSSMNLLRASLLAGREHLGADASSTSADAYQEKTIGVDALATQKKEADDAKQQAGAKEQKADEATKKTNVEQKKAADGAYESGDYVQAKTLYVGYAAALKETTKETPQEKAQKAKAASEAAKQFFAEKIKASNMPGEQQKQMLDGGQEIINKGDAFLREGKYEEAAVEFNNAKAYYEGQAKALSAAVETDQKPVDKPKLLGELQAALKSALRKFPPAGDWIGNGAPSGLKGAMQDAYNKIADTDNKKLALGDSAISVGYVMPNRRGFHYLANRSEKENGIALIQATFTRSGNVELSERNDDKTKARLAETKNEDIESLDTITASETGAVEKTETRIKAELDGIINKGIEKFNENALAMDSDLEQGLTRVINQYLATLSPAELAKIDNYSTASEFKSKRLQLTYKYSVSIKGKKATVMVD